MPSHPIATWITPCNSRNVQVLGTSTRRHTIGLIPSSQTLTCTISVASASAADEAVSTTGLVRFGARVTRPAYRRSPFPVAGTPDILMLSREGASPPRGCPSPPKALLCQGHPASTPGKGSLQNPRKTLLAQTSHLAARKHEFFEVPFRPRAALTPPNTSRSAQRNEPSPRPRPRRWCSLPRHDVRVLPPSCGRVHGRLEDHP